MLTAIQPEIVFATVLEEETEGEQRRLRQSPMLQEECDREAADRQQSGCPRSLQSLHSRGSCKHGIDETFRLVHVSLFTKRVDQVSQNIAQHFIATPLLESAVDGFNETIHSSYLFFNFQIGSIQKICLDSSDSHPSISFSNDFEMGFSKVGL